MPRSLVDSELVEMNALLADYRKLEMPHTILLGGGFVCAVLGIPGIVAIAWLNGRPLTPALVYGAVFVVASLLLAKVVKWRQAKAFTRMQRIASKLSEAGYQVFKRQGFLQSVLSASSEPLLEGAVPLLLHSMTLAEFEAAVEE